MRHSSNFLPVFTVYSQRFHSLFECGNDIVIFKENKKSESWVEQNDDSCFDYNKIPNALKMNPRKENSKSYVTPKRILVLQLK